MTEVLDPVAAIDGGSPGVEVPWCTASLRPVGLLHRGHARRIGVLLEALSGVASVVCLDLEAASLRGSAVVAALEDAARRLAENGGALLVVHASQEDAEILRREAPSALPTSGG